MVVAGRRLRVHELAAAAHPRRRDRRHLADRQRGRARSSPSSRRRSARPSPTAGGRRRSPGTTSSATSRRRRARSAPGCSARRCIDGGLVAARRLPRDRRRLRASSGSRWSIGFWRLGRAIEAPPAAAADRRHPAPSRPRPLEGRRAQAVGPVLDRRVRRRVHPAEPDGLLVPPPVRRRPGAARR